MKLNFIFIIFICFSLSSCGIYVTYFRPIVVYDEKILSENRYHIEGFPSIPAPFNTRNLESIVDSINYESKSEIKLLINYKGQVIDTKPLKINLLEKDYLILLDEIKKTKWIPFYRSTSGISILSVYTKTGIEEKGWIVPMWPKPSNKTSLH